VAAERVVSLRCDELESSGNISIALSASSVSLTCQVPTAASLTPTVVAIDAYLFPVFRSSNRKFRVACGLNALKGAGMGTAAVNISMEATFWPTFDDALVVASK
jgi:hypothetical protein